MEPVGFDSNKAADYFADAAAARVQLSDGHVGRARRADTLAWDVLKCLLSVQREVAFARERERGASVHRKTKGQVTSMSERLCRLREAGHVPRSITDAVTCASCCRSFSRKGKLCDVWPGPCKPRIQIERQCRARPEREPERVFGSTFLTI